MGWFAGGQIGLSWMTGNVLIELSSCGTIWESLIYCPKDALARKRAMWERTWCLRAWQACWECLGFQLFRQTGTGNLLSKS